MAIAPKKPAPAPVVAAARAAPVPPPAALPPPPEPAEALAQVAPATSEFGGALRENAEKTLAQSRAAYAKARLSADQSSAALEASYAAARAGVAAINAKAFDVLRANVEANFDFLKSTLGVASVADYFALQSDFTRKQIEAASAQAREFGAMAQKVTLDAAAPIKAQVAKALNLSYQG